MNQSTVKWAQYETKPIQRTVRSVHMCVHCTVHNCCTILHRTDLIIFPLTLQTITIAQLEHVLLLYRTATYLLYTVCNMHATTMLGIASSISKTICKYQLSLTIPLHHGKCPGN